LYQVFISYSREHSTNARIAKRLLDGKNIPTWMDEGRLRTGDPLLSTLREKLDECRKCLFLANESSIKSQWCLFETAAFWGLNKPILTHIDGALARQDLPVYLQDTVFQDDLLKLVDEIDPEPPAAAPQAPANALTEERLFAMLREVLGPLAVDQGLEDRALSLRGLLHRTRTLAPGPSRTRMLADRLGPYVGLPVDALRRAFSQTWDQTETTADDASLTALLDGVPYVAHFVFQRRTCVGVGVFERDDGGLLARVGAYGSPSEELVDA
jgi:hypothetical protein